MIYELLNHDNRTQGRAIEILLNISRESLSILGERLFNWLRSNDKDMRNESACILLNATALFDCQTIEMLSSIVRNVFNTKIILNSTFFRNTEKLELCNILLSIKKLEHGLSYVRCVDLLTKVDVQFEEQAVTDLIPLLTSQDYEVRSESASLLSRMKKYSGIVIPALRQSIEKKSSHSFIYLASKALNDMGGLDEQTKSMLDNTFISIFDQNQKSKYGYYEHQKRRNHQSWLDTLVEISLSSELIVQRAINLLYSPLFYSYRDQIKVIEALGQLGKGYPQVTSELVSMLDSNPSSMRASIIQAICKSGNWSNNMTERLPILMTENNPTVRFYTMLALDRLQIHPQPVIDNLRMLLDDQSDVCRLRAAQSLVNIGIITKPVVATALNLMNLEGEDNTWLVIQAIDLLGDTGNCALLHTEKIYQCLHNSNIEVRFESVKFLIKFGILDDLVVQTIISLLSIESEDEKWILNSLLRKINELEKVELAIIDKIYTLLKDEDISVRFNAAETLIQHDQYSEVVTEAILSSVSDSEPNNRFAVASILGKLSKMSDLAISCLTELLNDSDSDVRVTAAESLIKSNCSSESVIHTLLPLLENEDSWVRITAIKSIGKLSNLPEEVLSALKPLCKDSYYRDEVLTALYKLSAHSKSAERALLHLLEPDIDAAEENEIKRDFIWIVARAAESKTFVEEIWIEKLGSMACHTDDNVRSSAIEALYELSKTSNVASLNFSLLLKSNDVSILKDIFTLLVNLEDSLPDYIIQQIKVLPHAKEEGFLSRAISAYFALFFKISGSLSQPLVDYLLSAQYDLPNQVKDIQEDIDDGLDFIILGLESLIEAESVNNDIIAGVLRGAEDALAPLVTRLCESIKESDSHISKAAKTIAVLIGIKPDSFLAEQSTVLGSYEIDDEIDDDVLDVLGSFSRLSDVAANALITALKKYSEECILASKSNDEDRTEKCLNALSSCFYNLIESQTDTTDYLSDELYSLLNSENVLMQGIAAYGLIKLDIDEAMVAKKLKDFLTRAEYELPFEVPEDSIIRDALDTVVICLGRLLNEEKFGFNVSSRVLKLFKLHPEISSMIMPRLESVLANEDSDAYEAAINILTKVDFNIESHQVASLLIPLLKNDSEEKRILVIRALGNLGYSHDIVIANLSEMLWDEHKTVRDEAIKALSVVNTTSNEVSTSVLT